MQTNRKLASAAHAGVGGEMRTRRLTAAANLSGAEKTTDAQTPARYIIITHQQINTW